MHTTPSWQEISAQKIAARDALIPADWVLSSKLSLTVEQGGPLNVLDIPRQSGILTDAELAITEEGAAELVEKMAKGELKSVDVTRAFCKRAAIAQQLTNCLTEIMFEEALKTASECDAYLAANGKPLGPLHGLPISLKDNFEVNGVDTTVGFVGWSNDPCSDEVRGESEMTKILRQSGAILFCKTNVPTAMMIAESYNNTWGYTTNPLNRNMASGGSSGGESALLAMKGSPLGIGTDIGGSIRIPASFCNLFALKPSFGRFSTYGARSGLPGQESVFSINGPMASTLGAVKLLSKTVVDAEWWQHDIKVLPIPWRSITLPEKLSFGIIYDDGVVRPTVPILRGLRETAAALRAAGHEVIEYVPYDVAQGVDILSQFFLADGGVAINKFLGISGEPYPRGLAAYKSLYESDTAPMTASELWNLQAKRNAYVKAQNAKWASVKTQSGRRMDGVISPSSPYPGCLYHTFKWVAYTGIWNISDQTSVVFPSGVTVDPAVDVVDTEYVGRNPLDEETNKGYDPVKQVGGPVALQLIGGRLEEEKVIAMTEVVMEALKAYRA